MRRIAIATTVLLLGVGACTESQDTPTAILDEITVPTPLMSDDNIIDPNFRSDFDAAAFVESIREFTANLPPVMARDLTPDVLEATLQPGETVSESKTVTLEGAPPKGDILFSFDLTGSMWTELDQAKTNAGDIMAEVATVIDDVEFGVISYMDYLGSFTNPPLCYGTYPGPVTIAYGSDITVNPGYDPPDYSPDYPYQLGIGITASTTDAGAAIGALPRGSGADGPESYARAFYESYADDNIGWRDGARRILVNFGDNIPHDCDILTGWDPGRNGIIDTPGPLPAVGDDLDWDAVIDGMAANNITLINIFSGGSARNAMWEPWAEETGGISYLVNSDGTFPSGLDPATEIATLIEEQVQTINSLTLELCAGDDAYAGWLQSVDPAGYTDLNLEAPVEVGFDIVVGPPEGTEDGTYSFGICAVGDGAEYGRQNVAIEVVSTIEATIDIKPGSWPNSINLGSKGKGKAADAGARIAVALFSTADFDATLVDVSTVTLGDLTDPDTPVVLKKNGKYQAGAEDVNGDGLMDMVYHFPRATLIDNGDLTEASEYLWLTGIYVDGRDIIGVDAVRVIY